MTMTQAGRLQATEVRTRGISSAGNLFMMSGFAPVTMAAVADHAEVDLEDLQREFPDKETLFRAVYDENWARVNQQIGRATANISHTNPRGHLIAVAQTIWQMCDSQPEFARILLANCSSFSCFVTGQGGLLTPENGKYVARVHGLAALCVERQSVRRISAAALREVALGTIDSVLLGWVTCQVEPSTAEGGRISVAEAVEGLKTVLENC